MQKCETISNYHVSSHSIHGMISLNVMETISNYHISFVFHLCHFLSFPPPPLCSHHQSSFQRYQSSIITNIAYPFWFVHDDSTSIHSYCSYRTSELAGTTPSLQLPSLRACMNNTLIIHLSIGNYTVTNIDYKTHTISLVDIGIVFIREEYIRVYHNLICL